MAQDQFGNYICDISPIAVSPLPSSMFSGGNLTGNGSPEGVVDAAEGTLYTDQDPPYSVYVKTTPEGVLTGWYLKLE